MCTVAILGSGTKRKVVFLREERGRQRRGDRGPEEAPEQAEAARHRSRVPGIGGQWPHPRE